METLLGILAETIISLLINDLAQQPRWAALCDKISGDSPQSLALQYALAKTYGAFAEKYPELAHSFFDEHFLQQPGVASELARLLTPAGMSDTATLVQLWQAQFVKPIDIELADKVDFFVQTLNSEIKERPELKPFVDSRAFEKLYEIADSNEQLVDEQRIGNAMLGEMRQDLKKFFSQLAIQPDNEDIPIVASSPAQTTAPYSNTSYNPFNCSGRIIDPKLFFDRESTIRELQQALTHGNSIALTGDRGVGKSSLIYYIGEIGGEWLPNHEIIYLELEGVVDEIDFCTEILRRLNLPDAGKRRSRQDALRTVKQAIGKHKLLLILDTVEKLGHNNFKSDLQGILRALTQEKSGLVLLVAPKHSLDLGSPHNDKTSPLYNILRVITLPNFTRKETEAFIRHRLKSTNIRFDDQELDELWANTQGHPSNVQRAAEELYRSKIIS